MAQLGFRSIHKVHFFMTTPTDRVAVFIDYQNAYHGARAAFFNRNDPAFRGQIRPRALGMKLRHRSGTGRTLVGVFVYRGLPSSRFDPKGFGAAERQIAHWQREGLVEAWSRPLNYRVPSQPREKGVDVKIAIDMVAKAIHDVYDVAILVSDDTDFVPALEAVMEIKGTTSACEIATWVPAGNRPATPIRVPDRSVWAHRLTETDYGGVEDLTNYARRSRRR